MPTQATVVDLTPPHSPLTESYAYNSYPSNTLTLALINARSIVNKIAHLRRLVSKNKPDIVLVTESWCNHNVSNDSILIDGYHMARNDRMAQRGGDV